MNYDEREIVKLLRLLNHDYMNLFQVISGYLQLGRSEQALAFLKDSLNALSSRYKVLRWVYPGTVLLILLWQKKFFDQEKKLVVQSDTDLQGIGLAEDQLNTLLDSLLSILFAAGGQENKVDWVLKVEEDGNDYIFTIEYPGEMWPECDWMTVQSQGEEWGCRLERKEGSNVRRLVIPKETALVKTE